MNIFPPLNPQNKLESNPPLYIYGTGTVGREIFRLLRSKQIYINGFMDHRVGENPILGTHVYLPDDEQILPEKRSSSNIVIAIHNREAQIAVIIENLRHLGYGQIITLIDLYNLFSADLGQRYWLAPRAFYNDYQSKIKEAQNLFTDAASRDLFDSLISFRMSGDYSILPTPDLVHQYVPPDIPSWGKTIRFVDCGAFDGDTLRNFIESNMSVEALAAFEPDQNNFQKLSKYVQENQIPNTSLWPCGVYSSTTQINFSAGKGEASVITKNGEAVIQCVSLDEAIPNFKPTLIKMDIEGAEIEALNGAEHLIKKYKPGLAISVYHLPAHIWEIPLLIKKMMPTTYQYFLRAHGFNDFDIVFYAIPI